MARMTWSSSLRMVLLSWGELKHHLDWAATAGKRADRGVLPVRQPPQGGQVVHRPQPAQDVVHRLLVQGAIVPGIVAGGREGGRDPPPPAGHRPPGPPGGLPDPPREGWI